MSGRVKCIMCSINIACLIVALLFPTDVTPLILLTTIAATISWAFTTQNSKKLSRTILNLYIGGASLLALICIVLGISTSLSQPFPEQEPQYYELVFKPAVAGMGGFSFDYMYFAVLVFVWITLLMVGELMCSTPVVGSRVDHDIPKPITITISDRINQFK